MAIGDVNERYNASLARAFLVGQLTPLHSSVRIALTGVTTGFDLAPAVQAAYIGAYAASLTDGIWEAAEQRNGVLDADRNQLQSSIQARLVEMHTKLGGQLPVTTAVYDHEVLDGRVALRPLLEAAARHVFIPRDIPVDAANPDAEMVACEGSSLGLHELALREVLEAGKLIVVPEPYFGAFATLHTRDGVTLGSQLVTVPTRDSGHRLRAKALEETIRRHGRERIGALLITIPNNPTFLLHDQSEMQELADVIVREELFVVCDELFAGLERPGHKHISLASMSASAALGGRRLYDQVLTTTGTSKVYNLEELSLRSGVACCGDRARIQRLRDALPHGGRLSREMVIAGATVYEHSDAAYKTENRKRIADASARLEQAVAGANERLGFDAIRLLTTPQAAFYACLTLAPSLYEAVGITNSDELFEYLYMCTGVVTKPLSTMGTDVMGVRLNLMGGKDVRDVEVAISRFEELARRIQSVDAPAYWTVRKQIDQQLASQTRATGGYTIVLDFGSEVPVFGIGDGAGGLFDD